MQTIRGPSFEDSILSKDRTTMPTIRFFIISCSSDGLPEPLFVWGEGGDHSMPTTREEAERRITICQEKIECALCDAQIHQIRLVRLRAVGVKYNEEYSRTLGRHKLTKK
jgi:hypothetical protein